MYSCGCSYKSQREGIGSEFGLSKMHSCGCCYRGRREGMGSEFGKQPRTENHGYPLRYNDFPSLTDPEWRQKEDEMVLKLK